MPIIYTPLIVTSAVFDIPALNFISVNIALLHVTNLINLIKFDSYMKISVRNILLDFVNLYQGPIKHFLHLFLFIISSVLYQELAVKKHLCIDCTLIDQFYRSGLVLFSIACGSYLAINVFYVYTFVTRRLQKWKEIATFSYMFKFSEDLSNDFEVLINRTNYLSTFINSWLNRNTNEMKDTCKRNSHSAYMHMITRLNRTEGPINYSECRYILLEMGCKESDLHQIWKLLSVDTIIDENTIYLNLWRIYRERRLFAAMNYTDTIVVRWLVIFGSMFLYGLGVVFIIDIFDYEQAFGSGIDVFKIYLLAATYLVGMFKEQIHFMILMVYTRPYNVHDILEYDSNIWEVVDIKLSETVLQGPHFLTVPNTLLLANGIKNFTRGVVKDSYTISVPYSFHNAEERVTAIMTEYLSENNDNISGFRIDCNRLSPECVTIQINWQYTYEIYSISSRNAIRKSIYDYIYRTLEKELEKLWLEFLIVNGGGYNNYASKHKFD